MRRLGLALALALLSAGSVAQASTYVPEKVRCPVGGETFKIMALSSMSTYGERPDGKPYGSAVFPIRLSECPKNKLLLYRDFSPEEVKQLAPLIASRDYLDLSASDLPYYRASWLERRLKPQGDGWAWLLLRATWEADDAPDLKKRYQAEFVEAASGLAPRPDDLGWLALQARAINALRELGRFDEASARLATLPRLALESGDDPENRQAWADYLRRLDQVIARKDASAEPLDMLSEDMAIGLCLDMTAQARAASVGGFCVKPEIAAKIDTVTTNRALSCIEMEKEVKDIWSDEMCAGPGVRERATAIKTAKPGDPYWNATEKLP